ncbi:hypothetical protein CN378_13385 [Bacillus sp. AFS015802]|uniref:hypothetical protein n=1 Tax=Bacillus sp. AFS015802 TaxID=2033486 RepID=UPI000BF650D1|nr:hypothetical protein [Bacillus sp. AFS015802]PFA66711.1 hypothetical protein CN378_13385 [Bacillus sp. AFS015802]
MVWLFVLIPMSFMVGVVIVGSIKERYFSQGYLKGESYNTHKTEGFNTSCRGQSNSYKWYTGGN